MTSSLLQIAGLYVVGMLVCYFMMARVEPLESWTERCALMVICVAWPFWLIAFTLKAICQ